MIEELKLIVGLFQQATDKALYAFIAFGVYKLAHLSLLVFPMVGAIKFIANRIIADDSKED